MSVRLGFKAEDVIAEGRVTNHDVNQINIWLREQSDLPIISEEEIVNFLLSNDNEQERTKNTIKAFFKIRNESPDIFSNRLMTNENSDSIQSIANVAELFRSVCLQILTNEIALNFENVNRPIRYFGIAPKRTKDNHVVIYAQLYNPRYQSFNLALFNKFLYLTLDAAIYSSPPSGLIIVTDAVGVGFMHLTTVRPTALSVCFRYLQQALPVKLKNIHILNVPYFMDKILAIMKPFMSDHIRELMIFHKRGCNMDEFYEKYVSKEFLPEDYGGELPCMKDLTKQLIENLKFMEPYFTAEEKRRSIMN